MVSSRESMGEALERALTRCDTLAGEVAQLRATAERRLATITTLEAEIARLTTVSAAAESGDRARSLDELPPPPDMTKRRREVLQAIGAHYRENGYAPSVRDLARLLGLRSTHGVAEHLAALERVGAIRRGEGARAVVLLVNPWGER